MAETVDRGRPQKYGSAAEKQAAYRNRLREAETARHRAAAAEAQRLDALANVMRGHLADFALQMAELGNKDDEGACILRSLADQLRAGRPWI